MAENKHLDRTGVAVLWQIWMRRGPVACLLWPLSLLFGSIAALRRFAYHTGLFKRIRLAAPIIVVGNLFVGGTGKTPLTIWLVEMLQRAGYHPGVISRGYGGSQDAIVQVSAQSRAHEVGDEPVLIAQRTGCPLMVGRDRVAAAQALLRAYPQVNVIVADDGLQHYRLARDIEIVLSDTRGAGNGWLLPAGPLREPVSRRRDFSVVNVGTLPPGEVASLPADAIAMCLQPSVAQHLVDRSHTMRLDTLAAILPRPAIMAAAGIGHPERFFATLSASKLVFETLPLPDHHVFTAETFAHCQADFILITDKDAVKCREIPELARDGRFWVVPVSAQLDVRFAETLLEKLRGYATA